MGRAIIHKSHLTIEQCAALIREQTAKGAKIDMTPTSVTITREDNNGLLYTIYMLFSA